DASTSRVYVADTGNNRVQVFDTNGTYISKFGTYGASDGQLVLPYRVITETGNTYVYVMDTLSRIQRFIKTDGSWSATLPLGASGAGMKIMPGTPNSTLYVTSLPTTFQTYNESSLALSNTMTNDIGHPIDMSLDTYGNIYINNNFPLPNEPVVQKFNSSFIQQAEWTGSNGGVDGSFGITISGPLGIGTNTGNDLYVADTDKNRIQKFTADGTYVYSLTPIPTIGVFNRPRDVATEATGKFYVADTGNSRVIKFSANAASDPNGGFIWSRTLPAVGGSMPTPPVGSVASPYGITVDSLNKIYVADAGYHRILRYDANGTYEAEWGTYGSADNSTIPQLDSPQGMAIDPSGNIYVADTGNNRIQRFDQNGTLGTRVVWGVYGTQDGNFNIPRNVAVDSANRVFVSEVGNRRIQVFGDATASAGLTITQTGGTSISEGTSSATIGIDSYTVKLTTQPSAPVTVAITVSDPSQATVNTPTLAFTQYNWNIPQTVTVVPIHDHVSNGTRAVIISHKPSSTDIHYANTLRTSWSDVTVTITDNIDIPGITFSTNNVPLATEGATLTNAYTIVLNTKPTSNVTVSLAPASSLQVAPASILFTPASGDWDAPRQVHILPVHDYVAQGTHVETIYHTSASTDTNYGPGVLFSESSGNVTVNVTDIDAVGVVFSKPSVSVTENGTTDTYTVNLASKPTQDVEIFIKDASQSALLSTSAIVSMDPSPLTFTSDTWSPLSPQTVTVTAVHDFLKNPLDPRTTNIEHFVNSGDTTYDSLIATVSATVRDSDAGGLLIYKPGGGSVAITEGGATDEYAFQLSSIPNDPVTVTLSSTDHQATTSAYIYTFTPSNWNTPQYATISAVDDSVQEGNHYGIISHTLSSLDPNFNGLISYETATITDNDVAGITARLPNGVINIAEAGPTDTYYVKLNSLPTFPVTLIFGAQNQATASPANLIFNASNWNDEQEITLSAIQDYMIEGPHTATISYTASSSDTNYNGKTTSFTANISDDDSLSPGIFVNESNGGTAVEQDSYTDTYTIALASKPSANVKIKIIANGPEATTSAGIFWFTPNVWNVPQTVTVTAKRNPSGGATVVFTHLVTSLDAHYNGLFAPTVNVTVNEHHSSSSSSSGSDVKAPVCSKSPPPNAPNLFQINTTQTEATLYFTPIKDNISYYFIAYGFTPGDLRFGTSFEFGSYDGVIDHTVSMLTPGTKYYFQVRGGNGCATGPWSGSVPATAVGVESSAQTVHTYYAPATPINTSGSSSSGGSSSPTGGIWLTRDLYPGSQGADVRSLQEHLNAHGFTLATSGAGSPGNETTYYGNLTAAAVRRFQEAHFAEILSPLGYASGTGICGPSTRNYINSHP
ncbi:MAG: peptidoglycan-binding protein, partial [Candidatus Roizmanbacteria bacterium]|nr:peptidoglycan-binding protein [Candidatus Roizmanbacteria bacterium]